MPNGRSGGFVIDKAERKQLLKDLQDSMATTKVKAFLRLILPRIDWS